MTSNLKAEAARIARALGWSDVQDSWMGIDLVLPLLEKMREEGAVVLIKLDGERVADAGDLPYTCVVQGGALGDDFFRLDTQSIEEALAFAIVRYAGAVWKV